MGLYLHVRLAEPTDSTTNATRDPSTPTWATSRLTALYWFDFGLAVIPVRPGTKATAVKWDSWLCGLSRSRIISHWRQYPDHEVGFIVGESIVVFDADSPTALSALEAAEVRSGVTPLMVVQTNRGEHHYFRRNAGSPFRNSARDFPPCLDVKTGRTMVILPPSTGKVIVKSEVAHASGLSVATQIFIDALRGGPHHMPLPTASRPPPQATEVTRSTVRMLQTCLDHLDPDLPYSAWFCVAAALFNTTVGHDDGYLLFDNWSATGQKYKGSHDTEKLWCSLRPDHPRPITFGTLMRMLGDQGVSWDEIMDAAEDRFELVADGSDQ